MEGCASGSIGIIVNYNLDLGLDLDDSGYSRSQSCIDLKSDSRYPLVVGMYYVVKRLMATVTGMRFIWSGQHQGANFLSVAHVITHVITQQNCGEAHSAIERRDESIPQTTLHKMFLHLCNLCL